MYKSIKFFLSFLLPLALTIILHEVTLHEVTETLAEGLGVDGTHKVKPITVGWIGGMTGPTAKWGPYQSALLAAEEINQSGGINGKPLKVIYEDGRCNSAAAVSAFHKLTGANNVKFILGGHCSPESISVASLAEKRQILTIAAITSSPKLSTLGDYIFRVTPVSTRLADLLVPYAMKKHALKKVAIIYELTDYVEPVALHFKKLVKENGGTVPAEISFLSGESDFRALILRATQRKPDSIYIGTQAPDTAMLIAKQLKELDINQKIYGNEQFAGAYFTATDKERLLLEGITFAEPLCDESITQTRKFTEKYTDRYQVRALPFGCYTAEPYDAMHLLAKSLKLCGEDVECVKKDLFNTKAYPGASGSITFDHNGDVDKEYIMKTVTNGKIQVVSSK